jgi:AcrR family transcriptional regulator
MTDYAITSFARGAPPERPAPLGNVKATRDDWLDLALSVLAVEGVARVTVLNLSERLGVSRSSFYWYFKNRDELLDALLDRWNRLNTRSIVREADEPAATVNEAVCNVFRCWVNPAIFSITTIAGSTSSIGGSEARKRPRNWSASNVTCATSSRAC